MTVTDDRPAAVLGSRLLRREDPALLTGEAKYTNDLQLPGALHLALARSPYAHARIIARNYGAWASGGAKGEKKRTWVGGGVGWGGVAAARSRGVREGAGGGGDGVGEGRWAGGRGGGRRGRGHGRSVTYGTVGYETVGWDESQRRHLPAQPPALVAHLATGLITAMLAGRPGIDELG